MKILALETSTDVCSVALWNDGEINAVQAQAGQRNSDVLLPMVQQLLGAHGLTPSGLDGVAFGAGPGSFTGVRIACGVAQGIALGAGIPVFGIVTLLALARASARDRVVSCLDARMGEIYHAVYERRGGQWRVLCEPNLCRPDSAPPLPPGAWTGCGSGFAAYRSELEQRYSGCLERVIPDLAPHARAVAELAAVEFARGCGTPAAQAVPLYVRNKVALRIDERNTC